MQVPFVDLKIQYASLKPAIDKAIHRVIDETSFVGGKVVEEFESNFAKLLGAPYCLGVANGTDALFIAMKMLGIGAGDEVITTASSWISTSETISLTGATPVFVDIDESSYCIDVSLIEGKITTNTKAIIPVHLYGNMAKMKELKSICDQHDLFLIEDCAQAHLAERGGVKAGLTGDVGTFSFYPGKNLGAYGDAGGMVFKDETLYLKCKKFARHGALTKHAHEMEGMNSRLDALQAAVLNTKLPYLEKWTTQRRENAVLYRTFLGDVAEVTVPYVEEVVKHVYHLFVIQVDDREGLKEYLATKGIQTAIHYPKALPMLPAYDYLKYKSTDIPVSSKFHSQILSLPMFAELSSEQIEYVCEHIKKYYTS